MLRWVLVVCSLSAMAGLSSALLQHRFKRQSAGAAVAAAAGVGNVDKSDLEALKVKIVQKFLLAVLFSAQMDEKRTNETKVRMSHFYSFLYHFACVWHVLH